MSGSARECGPGLFEIAVTECLESLVFQRFAATLSATRGATLGATAGATLAATRLVCKIPCRYRAAWHAN